MVGGYSGQDPKPWFRATVKGRYAEQHNATVDAYVTLQLALIQWLEETRLDPEAAPFVENRHDLIIVALDTESLVDPKQKKRVCEYGFALLDCSLIKGPPGFEAENWMELVTNVNLRAKEDRWPMMDARFFRWSTTRVHESWTYEYRVPLETMELWADRFIYYREGAVVPRNPVWKPYEPPNPKIEVNDSGKESATRNGSKEDVVGI